MASQKVRLTRLPPVDDLAVVDEDEDEDEDAVVDDAAAVVEVLAAAVVVVDPDPPDDPQAAVAAPTIRIAASFLARWDPGWRRGRRGQRIGTPLLVCLLACLHDYGCPVASTAPGRARSLRRRPAPAGTLEAPARRRTGDPCWIRRCIYTPCWSSPLSYRAGLYHSSPAREGAELGRPSG
ncbi:MAG: hypothetical protein ACRDZY_21545, partial [Acidimicrobiales bacterium]